MTAWWCGGVKKKRLLSLSCLLCFACFATILALYYKFNAENVWNTFAVGTISTNVTTWEEDDYLRNSDTPKPYEFLKLNASLEQCELVKELLSKNLSLYQEHDGKKLPEPGTMNEFGFVFFSKTPLATFKLDGNKSVILLRYVNSLMRTWEMEMKYKKWNNAITIATEFAHETNIFPKLYGYCRNLDNDRNYYLIMEAIDLHPIELPKPNGSFAKCFERTEKLLNLFVELDRLNLTMVDMKKGQWMSRKDGSFVFQDLDDIVKSPMNEKSPYASQIESAIARLSQTNLISMKQAKKLWSKTIFPGDHFDIRYSMILLVEILERDVGFDWTVDCGASVEFLHCFHRLLDFTATTQNDWPRPKTVMLELQKCKNLQVNSM